MISDAIALLELVRRIYKGRRVLSALFDPDGQRIRGDERIRVAIERAPEGRPVWFYRVEPFEDYQFVRIPVNPGGVIESLGTLEDEPNARAEFFRYIAVPDGRMAFGGLPPNVRVNFMVVAYRPSDLLNAAEE